MHPRSEKPNAVVLTESKAETWFGDANPIGKVIRMGKTDLVVRGVVKDNPANSSFQFNVLVPVSAIFQDENYRSNAANWRNFNYQLFLRLKAGTSYSQVKNQINRFYIDNRKDSSIVASLIPLKDIHFDNSFQADPLVKGNMRTVMIMGVIGMLILVIASINFVNLTTALASKTCQGGRAQKDDRRRPWYIIWPVSGRIRDSDSLRHSWRFADCTSGSSGV